MRVNFCNTNARDALSTGRERVSFDRLAVSSVGQADSANPLAWITHGGGTTSAARNVASWHRARNCRRQAVAGARQRRQSNERIFQLPAPAEMRRLCLSINMRRDKAAWSFIRSVGLWVCGSSRASRYALSFITGGFHAHFSPCPLVPRENGR